jgi:phage-related protein (TIGR01555 family)
MAGNVISFLRDRLTSVMSGMGTTADKRTHLFYNYQAMSGEQAEAGYRTSWLNRKIVDIPPFDMTRERRNWQAEGTDIEVIEREEKRLQLWAKLQRALVLARLYGGGALVLGVPGSNVEDEIRPEQVGKGGLSYVHVMSRQQLSEGQVREDPADPWFGQPEHFTILGRTQRLKLHPSRVVAFVGQKAPEGAFHHDTSWFWGDPIMQSIGEAVKNADLAQGGFASLIDEAAVDIIGIPDLMSQVGTQEYEDRLMARLSAAKLGASNWRMKIRDAAETWETRQVSWAGIPDTMMAFLQVVAGAADIPVTRLLGVSPKGLQSTGDGEERDYHSMVRARQEEMLTPALDRIDELLIRSALGSRPADVYYEFAPLGGLSEKEAAEVDNKNADTFKKLVDTGLLPDVAMAKIISNQMIETGRFPGCEAAFEEHRKELETPPEEPDETELQTRADNVVQLRKRGQVSDEQATLLMTDAKPRSLYVCRKVVNGAEIRAWAREQGIPELQENLHVTVIYSRTPVDWLKAGNASEWGEQDGKLTIAPGGPRVVEPLGDKSAVLMFASSQLSWRHSAILREAGAAHSFDEYIPHMSLTEAPIDLSKVEPYRGKIVLGPEIFEEVKKEAVGA